MSKILAQAHKAAKQLEKSRATIRKLKEALIEDAADGKVDPEDLRAVRELVVTDRIEARLLEDDFTELLRIATNAQRAV